MLGARGATDADDRAFLLAAAAWVLGAAPGALSLDRRCPTCGGTDHGRPRIRRAAGAATGDPRPLDVSLSRAGASVAVGLSFVGSVGIDIESVEAVSRAGFDDVAFNPAELAALGGVARNDAATARAGIWSAKEAALKAIGVGLRVDPRALSVSVPPAGGTACPALSADPLGGLPRVLPRLARFEAGPGLVGTIAAFTAGEPVVQVLPAERIRDRPRA